MIVTALLAGIGIAIGSRVAEEARQLIAHPPDIRGFLASLVAAHPGLAPLLEPIRGSVSAQLGEAASVLPRVSLSLLAASANLIDLIVIPILSFFILKDGALLRDSFLDMLSDARTRARAEETLAKANVLLLQYMRALLALCCTALIVLGAGLALAGVRYALLLATVAFFCEFVPMVGPIAEIAVILGVSALTGYPHILALAACLGVFRIVQDYVILAQADEPRSRTASVVGDLRSLRGRQHWRVAGCSSRCLCWRWLASSWFPPAHPQPAVAAAAAAQ